MVTGKLRQRSYEAKDGTKRTVYELAHCDVYLAPKRQPRPSQDFGQAEPFAPSAEAARSDALARRSTAQGQRTL